MVLTLSEFVSTIVSKLGITGWILVKSLFVDDVVTFVSIHLLGSNKDLLLPINDKIEVSLYPKLYSVELSILVSELVGGVSLEESVVNKLPIFSVNFVTDVSNTES